MTDHGCPGAYPPRLYIAIGLALTALTLLAFTPVCRNGFVNFDDDRYVTDNPHVQAGLTRAGVVWAWTGRHAGLWVPLTRLSLQLDAQLYGLDPAGFHRTNLLLHLANVLLLFAVLSRLTGAVWPSAFTAALFAVHPLHVESVAWVAERKDVLSTFFGLLAVGAYACYVARPSVPRYLAVAVLFALGLLAKPMLVTLPAALLLLDYWPLDRLRPVGSTSRRLLLGRLALEKLPLAVLAGVFAAVALGTEEKSGAVMPLAQLPVGARIGNALVACAAYLGKTAWPTRLAAYYPLHARTALQALGAAGLLATITAWTLWQARRRPCLLVGWLWFLGHLVPVLGLVQLGSYARADRYTYVPHVGLFVLVAWGVRDLLRRRPLPRPVVAAAAGLVLATCAVGTARQVHVWHDSETLWNQALRVTSDNALAHYNLGVFLADRGQPDAAAVHFAAALQTSPHFEKARLHLGAALGQQGREVEAVAHFARALAENPDSAEAHALLGEVLVRLGRPEEAVGNYAAAVRLDPDRAEAQNNLGQLLLRQGNVAEAAVHCAAAVRLRPDSADAHNNLGAALFRQGQWEEAGREYATALELAPQHADAHANLGLALEQAGRTSDALEHYAAALRLDPGCALAHARLGVALARRGQFEPAVAHFNAALAVSPDDGELHHSLGLVREAQGRMADALPHYGAAVRLQPSVTEYHRSLAYAYHESGQPDAAAAEYRAASQIEPDWSAAARHAAWVLATHPDPRHRNGTLALRLAKQACQASQPPSPESLDALAAAYAELGRFAEATAVGREARERASALGHAGLAGGVTQRLLFYEARRPFRDVTSP
jgi:tetratricopeptide (TPR) repeat protein